MTVADTPLTTDQTDQTDQGGEGTRLVGDTVRNSVIEWDLTIADKPSVLIRGLATEQSVDEKDQTTWTFTLRKGATFHDVAPRAMSPKAKGFAQAQAQAQAQNWYRNFSSITME